jgi:NADPH2:quinone reductase
MIAPTIPSLMDCIEIKAPGGPEQLVPARRPVPTPRPSEVLIKVAAAGVNRPDVVQRMGQYPPPPGASDLPGLEVAGEIVAVATDVKRWRTGDKVCALLSGGGYAAYAIASAGSCLPIPDGLDVVAAAAIPETFLTVWHNVFQRGGLKRGETLLVHGGTSGIGTAAIQLAKAAGAIVVATAGSDDKCAACLRLGADIAINYRTQDFVETIRALPHKGADVILDMVGGSYVARNLRSLRTDGRLVVIALLGGAKGEVDLSTVMLKRLTVTGSTLRSRDDTFKAALADAVVANIWPWLESRQVAPVIDRTFPLAAAPAAHTLMENSGHIGKIVLIP